MLATMIDRTLPLAERLRAAVVEGVKRDRTELIEFTQAMDDLLADIEVADRLARAMRDYHDTLDAGRKMAVNGELVKLADAMFAALDAYRERMAQGVDDV